MRGLRWPWSDLPNGWDKRHCPSIPCCGGGGGVVLVVSAGKVRELFPRQLVDALGHLWQVGLELGCVKHVLEVSQLLVRDLPLPLKLTSALCDHVPEACMVVHPPLERFWEPVGANLTDVHGEHDQVEIPFDV